jgi:hypothetical protein
MKIPNGPFQGPIEELILSLLLGGDCIGYEEMNVGAGRVSLHFPPGTRYALIVVEASPIAPDKSKVIRFQEMEGNEVARDHGMILGDLSVYEVRGLYNLTHFRAISENPGIAHVMRVQYYG